MDKRDRIRGCVLGLACGDALGAPVEFLGQSQLIAKYGLDGVTELESCFGVMGAYTDDTQMSLATARGVVAARDRDKRYKGRGYVDPTPYIYTEYVEWMITQIEDDKARRGPGNTCTGSLLSGIAGHVKAPINTSKGCGGVMRVAPIGLVYKREEAWRYGCASAALTHGHVGGYLPAGALAVMLTRILTQADILSTSWAVAKVHVEGYLHEEGARHFLFLMKQAEHYALRFKESAWTDEMNMRKLGAGWTGDEALAMAYYCALRHPADLRRAVQMAVHLSGDRDSVGSICGALMGALCGVEAVPRTWLDRVENRKLLETTAEQLHQRSMLT